MCLSTKVFKTGIVVHEFPIPINIRLATGFIPTAFTSYIFYQANTE